MVCGRRDEIGPESLCAGDYLEGSRSGKWISEDALDGAHRDLLGPFTKNLFNRTDFRYIEYSVTGPMRRDVIDGLGA